MKAMGGVNSPNNSSIPPTISITLATPRRDMSGTPALASAEGKPMNFWVPCATNRKATTMRRTPCRYGAHRSGIGPVNLRPRRLGREALGRQPPGFRKLAGKRLIPDDEGQLHDLRLAKMLAHLRQALLGHLEVVAGHPFAEPERGPLPLAEARALVEGQDLGQLLARDTRLHADGVADVHSVRHAVQGGHLDIEQGAKVSVDPPEPLDRAVKPPDSQHEREPLRHQSLGRRHLPEHPFPDLEECPGQHAGPFDLRDLCHISLP